MKKIINFLIVSILMISTVNADVLTMKEAQTAACRVIADNKSIGSGTVFQESNGEYFILTNGHVAANAKKVTLEFFQEGYKSVVFPGKLVWQNYRRNTSNDAAVISVSKNLFEGRFPKVIPLAPESLNLIPGTYIYGSGCPAARWMQSWQGRIIKDADSRIEFNMPPEGGQSGSGILTNHNNSTYLIGIVTWRMNEGIFEAIGGGVSLKHIYAMFRGEVSKDVHQDVTYVNYQLPKQDFIFTHVKDYDGNFYIGKIDKNGNRQHNGPSDAIIINWNVQCPDSNCPIERGGFPGNNGSGNNGGSNAWPGLPPISKEPDLKPIIKPDDSINQIKELEEKIAVLEAEIEKYKTENAELKKSVEQLTLDIDSIKKDKASIEIEYNNTIQQLAIVQGKLDFISNENTKNSEQFLQVVTEHNKVLEEKSTLLDKIKDLNEKLGSLKEKFLVADGELQKLKEKLSNGDLYGMFEQIKGWFMNNSATDLFWYGITLIIGWLVYRNLNIKTIFPYKLVKNATNNEDNKLNNDLEIKKKDNIVQKEYNTSEDEKLKTLTLIINNANNDTNTNTDTKCGKCDNKVLEDDFTKSIKKVVEIPTVDGELDYAEYFFKKSQGSSKQNTERWAFYCVLYKEAVQKLREGQLYFDDKVVLQGQRKTADAIENWVRSEFLKRMTIESIMSNNNIYHEAYLGMLYKESIEELKKGTFNVLGAKATADTLENWVHREFLRKLQITL